MNLLTLYALQLKLDQHIIEKHNIEPNERYMMNKRTNFRTELGELANELPEYFKSWSVSKKNSPKEVIGEEWADCLHLLISIGNHRNYTKFVKATYIQEYKNYDVDLLMEELFSSPVNCSASFQRSLNLLFALGDKLGFTENELKDLYIMKNEKNWARQQAGY
jgi:dimeric dUTPase (all-alpha-NTP-PPase superfamily)